MTITMNKNQRRTAVIAKSILAMILIFSQTLCLSAETETYKEDLNSDGRKETITAEDKFETQAQSIITVLGMNNNLIGRFSVPYRLKKVEFVDLNKDGNKQIIAWSSNDVLYTEIAIYGYKDGRLYKIFEDGSPFGIKANFKSKPPAIKIGRMTLNKEGTSYSSVPEWEIWVWDGKEFYK